MHDLPERRTARPAGLESATDGLEVRGPIHWVTDFYYKLRWKAVDRKSSAMSQFEKHDKEARSLFLRFNARTTRQITVFVICLLPCGAHPRHPVKRS